MGANGDGTLSWDEYISYLLKEADNALAHRRAQGCFLLEPPDPKSTEATAVVPGGVKKLAVRMETTAPHETSSSGCRLIV